MFSFPSYTSGWTLPPLWLTTRSVVNLWLRAWPCLRCVAKTKNMTKRRRRTIIGVKAWTNLGVATRCSSFPSIQSPSLHLHLILGSMVILWLRAWPCKYDRAPRADHNYGNIRTPQYSQISIFNIILIKSNSECESSEFPVLQQIIWCFNFIAGKFALSQIECHANSIWHWKFCVQYFNICRFSSNKHMNALNCILDVGSGRIARALIKASLLFRKLYVASPL